MPITLPDQLYNQLKAQAGPMTGGCCDSPMRGGAMDNKTIMYVVGGIAAVVVVGLIIYYVTKDKE